MANKVNVWAGEWSESWPWLFTVVTWKMKVFPCQPGHPRKSSRSFRVQPLHHSPCGTMISPCMSERKLCVCLMLTDIPSCPSGCIISDLRQYPDYPENKQRQGAKTPLCSPGFLSFHRIFRKDLIAEVYSLQSSHSFLELKKQKQEKTQSKTPLQQNFSHSGYGVQMNIKVSHFASESL